MKKVIAIKSIGEEASGDSPGFNLAIKGQELFIQEVIDHDKLNIHQEWKRQYKYVCIDLEEQYGGFYVKEDEVKEIQIITLRKLILSVI